YRRRPLGTARSGALARRAANLRPAHRRGPVRRPSLHRAGPPGRRRGRATARVAGRALRDPGALGVAAPASRGGARTPHGDAEAEHDYADAAALRREIAGWFNP